MTANTLKTARLLLEPFAPKHLTMVYVNWLNDPAIVQYSELRHRHHTLTSCEAYAASFHNSPHYFWAILTHQGSAHIGNITAHVDVANNLVDIGILIGEKKVWGQGFGLEAWLAVCHYLLQQRFRKITAGTLAANIGMMKIMQKSGMIEDGRRQQHFILQDKPIDIVHYCLFNKEII